MVAHLEDVHRGQQATIGEELLHGRLRVTGEQGAKAVKSKEHDH